MTLSPCKPNLDRIAAGLPENSGEATTEKRTAVTQIIAQLRSHGKLGEPGRRQAGPPRSAPQGTSAQGQHSRCGELRRALVTEGASGLVRGLTGRAHPLNQFAAPGAELGSLASLEATSGTVHLSSHPD